MHNVLPVSLLASCLHFTHRRCLTMYAVTKKEVDIFVADLGLQKKRKASTRSLSGMFAMRCSSMGVLCHMWLCYAVQCIDYRVYATAT